MSRCAVTFERLLTSEVPLSDADLAHVRTCSECRRMIEEAAKLDALLTAQQEDFIMTNDELLTRTTTEAVAVVHHDRTRRALMQAGTALLTAIIGCGAIFWTIVGGYYSGFSPFVRSREAFLLDALPMFFGGTLLFGLAFGLSLGRYRGRKSQAGAKRSLLVPIAAASILLVEYQLTKLAITSAIDWFGAALLLTLLTTGVLGWLAGSIGVPFKRLAKGRQISGVCMGLAQGYGISVALVRVVFVLLLALKGFGLLLYLVLDALMEVHPDDRGSMLRFRLKRWWRGRE